MVGEAVLREPVFASNTLKTGNLQGKFANFASCRPHEPTCGTVFRRIRRKFPVLANREFNLRNSEEARADHGLFEGLAHISLSHVGW